MELGRIQKIQFTKLSKYGITLEQFLNPPLCKICNKEHVKWNSKQKQNAKEIACKEMGYNYLLIINNNFDNLKNIKEHYGK